MTSFSLRNVRAGMARLMAAAIAFIGLSADAVYAERDGNPIKIDQGPDWSSASRAEFYSVDQGSRIMPLAWMKALKHKGSPFLADSLTRYGYLRSDRGSEPELPIGFVAAGAPGKEMVGMTCAACHTRELTYRGQRLRVDGGPAIADFQAFLQDLDTSVSAVLASDEAFRGFAETIIGNTAEPADIAALKTEVGAWESRYHTIVSRSLDGVSWGPSRLDAVSMILNRLAGLDLGKTSAEVIENNIVPAAAPVRYPFLWNAAFQARTQWPGFASNVTDQDMLGRNVGQVIGVFAQFHPKPTQGGSVDFISESSVDIAGLGKLEADMRRIGPPKWPWSIDEKLAGDGAKVYARPIGSDPAKGGCIECHVLPSGSPPNTKPWCTPLKDVGTDTSEYKVISRPAAVGVLLGLPAPPVQGCPTGNLQVQDCAIRVLKTAVGGLMAEALTANQASAADPGDPNKDCEPSAWKDPQVPDGPYKYEARVLSGIWAAAPYLHNGSVRNLHELLMPAASRSREFQVGPRYDPEAVGLADKQPGSTEMLTTDCSDAGRASGNSRCGHDYGTGLSDDDKKALLEYLKSL
jgi:mono/diheme cytochrome c family protein